MATSCQTGHCFHEKSTLRQFIFRIVSYVNCRMNSVHRFHWIVQVSLVYVVNKFRQVSSLKSVAFILAIERSWDALSQRGIDDPMSIDEWPLPPDKFFIQRSPETSVKILLIRRDVFAQAFCLQLSREKHHPPNNSSRVFRFIDAGEKNNIQVDEFVNRYARVLLKRVLCDVKENCVHVTWVQVHEHKHQNTCKQNAASTDAVGASAMSRYNLQEGERETVDQQAANR